MRDEYALEGNERFHQCDTAYHHLHGEWVGLPIGKALRVVEKVIP